MSRYDDVVNLAVRRSLFYPASEIYSTAPAGMYDYGPFGTTIKRKIVDLWRKQLVQKENFLEIDGALIMPEDVFKASGHLGNFNDPMTQCVKCNTVHRADKLLEENSKDQYREAMPVAELTAALRILKLNCPKCKGELSDVRQFNMMIKSEIGVVSKVPTYLRMETCQSIFLDWDRLVKTMRVKLPKGVAQYGTVFRNEISPRDFLFRAREFDLMEFEYFVRGEDWEKYFEYWRGETWNWIKEVGISEDKVHELDVPKDELAHYSKRTIDFEFDFPFGKSELYGLAYRMDFDLKNHKLEYRDEEKKESFIPHVIEPTFGAGRTFLALLCGAYSEDELGGEKRIFLKLKAGIAPVKVAVFPLLKNKPALVDKAGEIYKNLKKEMHNVVFDDNGNIGKRYRRQDEIGTPWCVTIDFETVENGTVTVRNRDTGEQERIDKKDILTYIEEGLKKD